MCSWSFLIFSKELLNRSEGLARTRLFHPWGASQRGGGQAQAFRVARCRTRSLVDIGLGPFGTRQGSSGIRMGPYLSRTPIRVHRVFRQGSSGAVGPYRLKSGSVEFPSELRFWPVWPNGP